MITIPLPIPCPTIEVKGNELIIHREETELSKQARERGEVLTIDDDIILCCVCKNPIYGKIVSVLEPPTGFRCGGWFCWFCLGQGNIANKYGFIIDQILCDIVSLHIDS